MVILLLAACVGNPVIAPSTRGCTDYDFDDPAAPKVKQEDDGDAVIVFRTPVERPNLGDLFDPDITAEADVIEVRELWSSAADAVPTCLEPIVTVSEFGAPIEVRWFTEDDSNVPFDTVIIEPPA